jgi:hypothetical protein
MVFSNGASAAVSLVGNELRKKQPDGVFDGGLGDLVAFPAGGSSSGGSWGRDGRVISACWAETRGACSQAVTMTAAISALGVWWEAKSASGVGSGFSGGVSLKSSINWQPAFYYTLPSRGCPAASKKLDGLCLS